MNVIINEDENSEKKKLQKAKKSKKPKKAKGKKEKKVRSAKEATSLMLGYVSLGLSILGVAALIFLSEIVAIVLGACALIAGFISLSIGKGDTLPSVVGLVAGFLSILSAVIVLKLGS
ncbi:MAG: hypothetical protein LUF89_07300 [Ruminococcus sp.]|nr:hypothetical protein [Ruminococcus sp.]